MTENRRLTVNANIIYDIIASQAGSVGKAVLECCMNGIDANATTIDISILRDNITIKDNGHGFRTREEVLRCFEQFGFEHTDRARIYGAFGVGRGQLMAFGTTAWRTRTFAMDLDIRAKGLDYDLRENLPDVPGLSVTATLYEPLSEIDRNRTIDELKRLIKYAQVAVTVNGTRVSHDPTKEKWTHDTESAWIKVTDRNTLAIYNQGVFVTEISRSQCGVGGVLVTKLGHPLALNMARNAILESKCTLWKALRKTLGDISGVQKKTERLSDHDREYLAAQTASADSFAPFEEPIFTLLSGRSVGLMSLTYVVQRAGALTSADRGDRAADALPQHGLATVLTTATLNRFGASTVTELVQTLAERIGRVRGRGYENERYRQGMDVLRTAAVDSPEDVEGYAQVKAMRIPDKELTPTQRTALLYLNQLGEAVYCALRTYRTEHATPKRIQRKVIAGKSTSFRGWTDGRAFIAIDLGEIDKVTRGGLAQMINTMHLIVHEYLHDVDDQGSHTHDAQFHEDFHELVIEGAALNTAAIRVFASMYPALERANTKQQRAMDLIHRSSALPPDDETVARALARASAIPVSVNAERSVN